MVVVSSWWWWLVGGDFWLIPSPVLGFKRSCSRVSIQVTIRFIWLVTVWSGYIDRWIHIGSNLVKTLIHKNFWRKVRKGCLLVYVTCPFVLGQLCRLIQLCVESNYELIQLWIDSICQWIRNVWVWMWDMSGILYKLRMRTKWDSWINLSR